MNTSLVIAIVFSGISIVSSLLIFAQYRRSRKPVPGYEIGAIAGSTGLALIVAATSGHFAEGVEIVLFVVAAPLAVFSAVMTFRARRRMRTDGR